MRNYSRLQKQRDFAVPLLEVLAEMPGHQGTAALVVAEVVRRYRQFITDDALEPLPSGELRCHKSIQWQRFDLVRLGLMDSPGRGLWRITAKGLDWLSANPHSTAIDLLQVRPERPKKGRGGAGPRRAPLSTAATGGEHSRWLEIIEQEVRSAREFLRGRVPRPSDERLCDLVQLCYMLELHQEARELFAVIDRSAVNQWLYGRTSRLASICAIKVKR